MERFEEGLQKITLVRFVDGVRVLGFDVDDRRFDHDLAGSGELDQASLVSRMRILLAGFCEDFCNAFTADDSATVRIDGLDFLQNAVHAQTFLGADREDWGEFEQRFAFTHRLHHVVKGFFCLVRENVPFVQENDKSFARLTDALDDAEVLF